MSAFNVGTGRQAWIAGIGLGVGLFGWWVVTLIFRPPGYILPPPAEVFIHLFDNPSLYLENTAFTVLKITTGGSIGVLSGLILGALVAQISLLRKALMPYLVTMRVLPKIAIAPVLLLYLGLGMETAVLFVAIISFFPMVISTAAGFERTPDRHSDLMESVAASPLAVFLHVTVRFALPDLFAGFKQAATLSVIGAIVAEWVVSTDGLGYLILVASENLQTDVLLAALFLLIVVGLSVYGSVTIIQRWSIGSIKRYSSKS